LRARAGRLPRLRRQVRREQSGWQGCRWWGFEHVIERLQDVRRLRERYARLVGGGCGRRRGAGKEGGAVCRDGRAAGDVIDAGGNDVGQQIDLGGLRGRGHGNAGKESVSWDACRAHRGAGRRVGQKSDGIEGVVDCNLRGTGSIGNEPLGYGVEVLLSSEHGGNGCHLIQFERAGRRDLVAGAVDSYECSSAVDVGGDAIVDRIAASGDDVDQRIACDRAVIGWPVRAGRAGAASNKGERSIGEGRSGRSHSGGAALTGEVHGYGSSGDGLAATMYIATNAHGI